MSKSRQTPTVATHRQPIFRCRSLRLTAFAAASLLSGPAFGHGTLHERVEILTTQLAASPRDARLHFDLACIYCQHEEWRKALAEIALVDRLGPETLPVDLLRGDALLGDERPAEARDALDRFIAAHPDHSRALLLRARALAALGENDASLAGFRAAWQTAPTPEPDLAQEVADALDARGHRAEAIQILAAAIKKLGAIPSLMLRAMKLEIAAGDFDSALARIDVLQQSAPRPEPWMAKRAALLAQAGRAAEARASWQSLINHLAALPNLERGSHAMSLLAEQARNALASL